MSVVEVLDSKRVPVKRSERELRRGSVPYYGATGIAGTIDQALFDEPLVLLGEDGAPFFDPFKPKAYLIDGPAWVNNHAHVLRPQAGLDRRFLKYYLDWFDYRGYANGTTRLKLTQAAMKRMPVLFPPLREQQRVVEILEDHLSRLEAAQALLDVSQRRSRRLVTAGYWHATHGLPGSVDVALEAVAEVRLGRQRSPKNHSGERMRPYLRAANVDWDRLRLDDVLEMNFTEAEERTYRLRAGDILLTEASGSPAEVGKSALYSGHPANVCFQNTLLRVRAYGANPEFLQKYLLAEAHAGRFMPEARGVGINHLGRARLAKLNVSLPAIQDQQAAVTRCRSLGDQLAALQHGLCVAVRRSTALRRAVLAAAFAGNLTGRRRDDEVIEELACV